MKVMTIVGTRPEIIKLSQVMKELDRHVDHTIVHTGQNYDYELNELFFEQLDTRRPDIFLEAVKGTPSETIGDIIAKADKVFDEIQPDALLIYGDTNSCLSVIPAKRRKIPIFHMEAGNRCFDQRVPEEVNRKIVDHLSDINLPLSEQARDYLIAEGIKPETIIKTGSPMTEVLNANMEKIKSSDILEREGLKSKGYIVMSIHREENVDSPKNFSNLLESIDECWVISNGDLLERIILNILSNAIKYSPSNSEIALTISMQGEEGNNQKIRIEIADQGPGIPLDLMENLFKPYQRGKDSNTQQAKGIGLGLRFVDVALKRLNSQIEFESSTKGTTFYFYLALESS